MRKRIVFSLLCSVLGILLHAENNQAIGLQIAFTEPIYRINAPSALAEKRSELNGHVMNGLKVGVVYDADIVKGFGSTFGINYTFAAGQTAWKDYGYNHNGAPITAATKLYEYRTVYQYHQGEVFVDWQYKFEIAKRTYLMLYTGPTIQCCFHFSTKDKYQKKYDFLPEIEKSIPSEEDKMDERMQRVNVTWGVGAGFQYKRYYLRGGYDFGIINPYNKSCFGDYGYMQNDAPDTRYTRGRLDQWQIKIGIYLWQNND